MVRAYCFATAAIYLLVGLLHLLHVVIGSEAVIRRWNMPMWVTWLAIILKAACADLGIALGSWNGRVRIHSGSAGRLGQEAWR